MSGPEDQARRAVDEGAMRRKLQREHGIKEGEEAFKTGPLPFFDSAKKTSGEIAAERSMASDYKPEEQIGTNWDAPDSMEDSHGLIARTTQILKEQIGSLDDWLGFNDKPAESPKANAMKDGMGDINQGLMNSMMNNNKMMGPEAKGPSMPTANNNDAFKKMMSNAA
ncbi:MAG: hypothetical protein V1898_00740 [Patescibacteria group bacterium]